MPHAVYSTSYHMSLLKIFVMERHYRHFLVSFIIHTVLYGLLHLSFESGELTEAYLGDILLLVLAVFGTAKRLPLLVLPALCVKFMILCGAILVTMMCMSNLNIKENTREDRMEFRRQRNYPEVINLLLENHPTVCIWIYCVVTLVTMDLSNGLKAFYSSMDCLSKPKRRIVVEKPPSYAICVTEASQSSTAPPPTYSEALKTLKTKKPSSSENQNNVSLRPVDSKASIVEIV